MTEVRALVATDYSRIDRQSGYCIYRIPFGLAQTHQCSEYHPSVLGQVPSQRSFSYQAPTA